MRKLLLLAFSTVLVAGFAEAGTVVLTEQEVRDGRKLYNTKCARCHKFYDPARYADREWREWMDRMSRKAKLKPDQKGLLLRYLETFRSRNQTNAPPRAASRLQQFHLAARGATEGGH